MRCAGEFPLLAELYSRFQEKGFSIVAISIDDDCVKAVDAAHRHGFTWPAICEGKSLRGQIARLYSVEGTPTYFLVGRKGELIAKRFAGRDLESILVKAIAAEPGHP